LDGGPLVGRQFCIFRSCMGVPCDDIKGTCFEIVDLKYPNGKPAVVRQTDGSGFLFYPSGRKAVCVNGCKGSRRFSAVVYDDAAKSPLLGTINEWGVGSLQESGNLEGVSRYEAAESGVSVINPKGQCVGTFSYRGDKHGELSVKLNSALTVRMEPREKLTVLELNCERVQHMVWLGEVSPHLDTIRVANERTAPLRKTNKVTLINDVPLESSDTLGRTTKNLRDLGSHLMGIKSSTSVGGKATVVTEPGGLLDVNATLTGLLQGMREFATEGGLRKKIRDDHLAFPRAATINKWSGRYTVSKHRDCILKPLVETPQTCQVITSRRLQGMTEELSDQSVLIVAICTAIWADQSKHALRVAERTHAELLKKHMRPDMEPSEFPFRFVNVEMTEAGALVSDTKYVNLLAKEHQITALPWCLMFFRGQRVHSAKMGGFCERLRYPSLARPRVLLLEPQAAHQLESESAVKRCGLSLDLALSSADAHMLAGRTTPPYGIVMASSECGTDALVGLIDRCRRRNSECLFFLLHHPHKVEETPALRKLALDKDLCNQVITRPVRKARLELVINRYESTKLNYPEAGLTADDFVALVSQRYGDRGATRA